MSHEFWRQIFANAFFINLFRSSSSQMFFKTGVLKNLQFYLKKGSTTGVFLWTLRSVWEHLFSQNISGSWFCLFWNMEKYIHTNIFTRKTPVMVSFLVRLQPWGLTTLLKSDSLLDVFVKFAKFYRISFLRKTAGRLVLISCNISDISLTLLAINQLSHNCLSRTSTKSGSLAIHSVYLENI